MRLLSCVALAASALCCFETVLGLDNMVPPAAASNPHLSAWLMTAIVLLVVPFAQGATLSKMFREHATVSYRSTGLKMALNGTFGSIAPFPANLLYWANFSFEGAILLSNIFVDWKSATGAWQPQSTGTHSLEYILLSQHINFIRYIGKCPKLLSKGMERTLGYSLDEMRRYYYIHGEVISLLYKSPQDIALVQTSLADLNHGKGYQRVFFPTSKRGIRRALLFTSYPIIYQGRSVVHRWIFGARRVIGSNRIAVDISFMFPLDEKDNVIGFVPTLLLQREHQSEEKPLEKTS